MNGIAGGAAKRLRGTWMGGLEGVDRKCVKEFMGEYEWCLGGI
jgi:hypothetical protein